MSCPPRIDVVARALSVSVAWGGLCLGGIGRLAAQPASPAGQAAAEPVQVVIEREPLLLKSPETYRVPLHLSPVKRVDLAARTDGIVRDILINSGGEAREQSEILRLDSRERQLEMDRSKAAFQAAQIEQRAAAAGTAKEVADVRLQIAKFDLDLAEYRLDQTIHRAPFGGTLQTMHVVPGQFVRAGETLATLIDPSQLSVQIPIERNVAQVGSVIELRVEGKVAPATLQQVLPLTEPFEPLRELFHSIATGVAVIDNGTGAWHAGQTVYAALIPRAPVTEVPNTAISNTRTGGRRVQVMREGFVRDVPVELLGAVGEDRTIVTGPFGPQDELIVRTSKELPDGTQVVARTELVAEPEKPAAALRTPRSAVPPVAQ